MKWTFEDQENGIVLIFHNGKQWGEWFGSRDEAMEFHNALMHFISHPPMKRTA